MHHDRTARRDRIEVFYTARGDKPESVVAAAFCLDGLTETERLDPGRWGVSREVVVLTPELEWEGGEYPVDYSFNGVATEVRQLRDRSSSPTPTGRHTSSTQAQARSRSA